MADLVASLVGIVGAGTKVAMVLSQVAFEIGSAGKEAQIMAREIRSFCTIIRVLSQTMESLHSDMNWSNYSQCAETISDMTTASKEMFTEILGLIESIKKAAWGRSVSPDSPKFNLASRIRWVMNKPKFTFLRSALEAYKSNLSLLMGSIQLSQSLGPQSTSSSSGVDVDMLQRTSSNRASLAMSIDLQDIANDYQASMQEMEAARIEVENEEPSEVPPWESQSAEDYQTDAIEMQSRTDPHLLELIADAHDEVRSLRPASDMSSNSTASIYSSLSRHSQRLSIIVSDLPMIESMEVSERRKSYASSIRTTRVAAPPSLVSVPEVQQLRSPGPVWGWEQYQPKPRVEVQSSRAPEQQSSWVPAAQILDQLQQPQTQPKPEPKDKPEDSPEYLNLLMKYKNVKRLYFDGKAQIEQLSAQVSGTGTETSEATD